MKTQFFVSQNININGYVKDVESGESLIGANIVNITTKKGTTSNEYGYFSLKCPIGSTLQFSYLGFNPVSILVLKDTLLNIELSSKLVLSELIVNTSPKSNRSNGEIFLHNEQIENTPVLFGEADVVKALQFTPGIQQNKEGTSGFSVRGGSNDQNLFMLDGVPVYNINHLFGFFSVFSADAVSNMTFYKSGIPARFGGKLSSVTDIRLKEGNDSEIKGIASIGLISSKFSLEGPLFDKKATFYVSARRTYFDLMTKTVSLFSKNNLFEYYFQDFTLKTNYKINAKNRLFLSIYGGNDNFNQTVKSESDYEKNKSNYIMGWGNIISSLRWNRVISQDVFSNVTLYYSGFKYSNSITYLKIDKNTSKDKSNDVSEYFSGVKDVSAKWDIDVYSFHNHQIKSGIEFINHQFSPGVNQYKLTGTNISNNTNQINGSIYVNQEASAYAEDNINLSKYLKVNAGIRLSLFLTQKVLFNSIQPRISFQAKVTDIIEVIGSYNIQSQPVHLLSNSNIGTPSDLWLPVLPKLAPEESEQYSVGIIMNLPLNIEFGIEAFYKKMENLIELKPEMAVNYQSVDWGENVLLGTGNANGLEFHLNTEIKMLKFNLNYTLSKSNRFFEGLNNGNPFPFKYGSKHNISALAIINISKNRSLSVSWIYNSGYYISLSYDKYPLILGNTSIIVENNELKNNFKTPAFHHLDISYSIKKQLKKGVSEWNFGIYNAYGRTNPFYFYYDTKAKDNGQRKLYMAGLFPIVPSLSYTYFF